jgi:Fur family ferric uptake transcriptional regulator
MRKARELFEDYLLSKNLRLTTQRSLVLDIFLKSEGHLTTEEMYNLVNKKDSSVGHTTVYRTLKLLAECNIAREVDFGDGFLRYEHEFGHDHHDHLICKSCNKSIEVVDHKLEKLQERMALKHGFKVTGHRMDIFGLCRECQKKR